MTKINKKRAGALLVLTAVTAAAGFTAGKAMASDNDYIVKTAVKPYVETVTLTNKESLGEFVITAYCPCEKCCGEYADGYTASGTVATEGRTCAVDPDVIPLGTEIEIDGVKYIAEDVGGAIKGNRIDICFNDHRSALQYGVKCKEVYVQ